MRRLGSYVERLLVMSARVTTLTHPSAGCADVMQDTGLQGYRSVRARIKLIRAADVDSTCTLTAYKDVVNLTPVMRRHLTCSVDGCRAI